MLPRQQKPLPGEQREETSVQENSWTPLFCTLILGRVSGPQLLGKLFFGGADCQQKGPRQPILPFKSLTAGPSGTLGGSRSSVGNLSWLRSPHPGSLGCVSGKDIVSLGSLTPSSS